MIESKTINGDNQFTTWRYFSAGNRVDISIAGSFSTTTVVLRRKFSRYGDIKSVRTWNTSDEKWMLIPSSAWYCIGVATGNYTDGPITVMLVT